MADSYYKVSVTTVIEIITKAADAATAQTQAVAYAQHQRVAKSTVHNEVVLYTAGEAVLVTEATT